MRPLVPLIVGILAMPLACGADYPGDAINLEAHGFASFGYLRSYGNNWLATNTKAGTTDFWEAAANAIARPTDRLRLGAQLFTRKLGKFDEGQVSLDWAYADYRFADPLGIQVGRIKFPSGLYNESLDVDAARASVFLPPAIYALRSRDLFISVDGAKAYGLVELGSGGTLEYAGFFGHKRINERGGFATFMSESGLGDRIDRIAVEWSAGGMIHWDTPINGLAFRATLTDAHGFEADGAFPLYGMESHARVDDYYYGVLSALYETSLVTLAAEYGRVRGHGEITLVPSNDVLSQHDDTESAYASATWHVQRWLDLYTAAEFAWAEPGERGSNHAYTAVFAVDVMPIRHWSIKAEFRDTFGTFGVTSADNPGSIAERWQVLALKTTVDF